MRVRVWVALSLCSGSWLTAGTFEQTIAPILNANCVPCHDERTHTSGFSIATAASVAAGGARRGAAVKPGDPAGSPLVQVLKGEMKPQMPLGKTLPESQIAVIAKWIQEWKADPAVSQLPARAPYWAFVKPVRKDPPVVRNAAWARNPIDRFILHKLEEKGLQPAPEASRPVLIRRLYFDLLGLPPSPEQVKAFVENRSPRAYEELVDELLKNPHYGERWARHWLDLARYADTNGYEGDPEFPHAWRYRDYVIDAFNNDKPYDEFVIDQIAGDEYKPVNSAAGLPAPDPEKVVALTFLRLAPFTEPRGEESRDVLLSEMVSTTSSVFLGLTVGCAKCHDHKYDMVPTKDFYRMKAFFAAVYIERSPPDDVQQLGGPQPAEFYRTGEKQAMEEKRAEYRKLLASTETEFDTFNKPLLKRLAEVRRKEKPNETKEPTLQDLKRAMNSENNNALGLEKKDQTFSPDEKQQYADYTEKITRLKNRIQRIEPLAMSLRNCDDPPYGPSVPTTYVLIRGEYNHHGEPVGARLPQRHHRQFGSRAAAPRPVQAPSHPRQAHDPGQVDRQPRQSPHRQGDGEPPVAAPFRQRHCGNAQRLRQERFASHTSGTARLARYRVRRAEVEHQGHAAPDPQLQHLPSEFAGSLQGPHRGSGRPPLVALPPSPAGGRDHPR